MEMFHLQDKVPFCHQCKKITETAHDLKSATIVCTQCGIVLKEHIMTIFHKSYSVEHAGPSLGKEHTTLATHVSSFRVNDRRPASGESHRKQAQAQRGARKLNRLQQRIAMDYHRERYLYNVYEKVDDCCESLSLTGRVATRAKHLVRMYRLKRCAKPVRKVRLLACACVNLAARGLHMGRSLREFEKVTGLCTRTELGEYTKLVGRALKIAVCGATDAQMLRRYASRLGIPRHYRSREVFLLQLIRNQKLLGGRCPHSITSAVIFIIGVLLLNFGAKEFLKKISKEVLIAPNTASACIQIVLEHVPWKGAEALRRRLGSLECE